MMRRLSNYDLYKLFWKIKIIAKEYSCGGMREGLVFRNVDGAKSFKAVLNEFLMKYHNG